MSAPDFEKQGWALLDEYATRYSSGDHDDANYLASKLRAAYEAGARDEREACAKAIAAVNAMHWQVNDGLLLAANAVRARGEVK